MFIFGFSWFELRFIFSIRDDPPQSLFLAFVIFHF